MNLHIVRHGIAFDVGQQGIERDADRHLSPDGQRKTAMVGRGLRAMGAKPERIGASPLVRAEQTARILAAELGREGEVEICDFLAPGASARDVVAWAARGGWREAMIVGHNPDMPDIAAALIGSAAAGLLFKKAGAAKIAFDNEPEISTGELQWLIQPGQMLALLKASPNP